MLPAWAPVLGDALSRVPEWGHGGGGRPQQAGPGHVTPCVNSPRVFAHHVLSRSPGLTLPSPVLQAEQLRPREGRPPATQTHSAKHPNHACTPPRAQHCVLASTAQGQRGSRGVNHGRVRARKGRPRRAVRTDAQEAGRAESKLRTTGHVCVAAPLGGEALHAPAGTLWKRV